MPTLTSCDELLARVRELEAARDKEILYQKLFEQMLYEVHIWELERNAKGQIKTWRLFDANPAALKSWGKKLSDIRGSTTDEIFPGAQATETFMPIIQKIFRDGQSHAWEQYFAGTKQTLYMVSIPVGERFISCGVDITTIKQTAQELEEKSRELTNALMKVVSGLSRTLESRDPYTAGHQQRVAEISEKIALAMQLDSSRIQGLKLGASIHDVGKIAIPTEYLIKPTRLTIDELNLIKTHPATGAEFIADIKFPWPIREIILQHHERLDGSGYPQGLRGDEIILEARIVGVADVFESMSSHRPYRPGLGKDVALEELLKHKGKLYDPEVVEALQVLLEKQLIN